MGVMKRIWRQTVWGAKPPYKGYTGILKVWTPLQYATVILMGHLALSFGIPAFRLARGTFFDSPVFTGWFGVWQIFLAGIVLFGYIFRLTHVELVGLIFLTGQWSIYSILLLTITAEGDPTRGYVFGMSLFIVFSLMAHFTRVTQQMSFSKLVAEMDRGEGHASGT